LLAHGTKGGEGMELQSAYDMEKYLAVQDKRRGEREQRRGEERRGEERKSRMEYVSWSGRDLLGVVTIRLVDGGKDASAAAAADS
jgi:hypothetical protein